MTSFFCLIGLHYAPLALQSRCTGVVLLNAAQKRDWRFVRLGLSRPSSQYVFLVRAFRTRQSAEASFLQRSLFTLRELGEEIREGKAKHRGVRFTSSSLSVRWSTSERGYVETGNVACPGFSARGFRSSTLYTAGLSQSSVGMGITRS